MWNMLNIFISTAFFIYQSGGNTVSPITWYSI